MVGDHWSIISSMIILNKYGLKTTALSYSFFLFDKICHLISTLHTKLNPVIYFLNALYHIITCSLSSQFIPQVLSVNQIESFFKI
jgi:hypothetical protein